MTGRQFRAALESLFDSRSAAAAWLKCSERTIYRYENSGSDNPDQRKIPYLVEKIVRESLEAGRPL